MLTLVAAGAILLMALVLVVMSLGEAAFQRYGQHGRTPYTSDVDFVVVTNEDLGLTGTAFTHGTDGIFETTIPYPQEWDQDNEVCVLQSIEYHQQGVSFQQDDSGAHGYEVWMSYLDRSPGVGWDDVLDDAADEWVKSTFAGPMYVGKKANYQTATAATGSHYNGYAAGAGVVAEYVPPVRLSMFTPIYLDFSFRSVTYAAATKDETLADWAVPEQVFLRYFYNIRRMNPKEKALMEALSGVPFRWGQLGS